MKYSQYGIEDSDPHLSVRFHQEKEASRPAFHRDRDRLIHSSAFRRLKDKTQVIFQPNLDHHRTRLTHSLEVAQIARSLSNRLGVNEALTEVIALAHDLGHPPFGHDGEKCLNEIMKEYCSQESYNHNIHGLRILCDIENRYFDFKGLNLTFATLDGIMKHGFREKGNNSDHYDKINHHFPDLLKRMCEEGIHFDDAPSLEAQIAGISDDIAYTAHDLDDALREGTIKEDELEDIPMVCDLYKKIRENPFAKNHPKYRECLGNEIARAMIGKHVLCILSQVHEDLQRNERGFKDSYELRKGKYYPIKYSSEFLKEHKVMKKKLYEKIFSSREKQEQKKRANRVIKMLFDYYMETWKESDCKVQEIVTHIAGMTDGFAYEECKKILYPQRLSHTIL